MLVHTGRYEMALTRFTNLHGLDDVDVFGHLVVLDDDPIYVYLYYTEHGILL